MTSASGAQPPPRQVIFIDFSGVISTDEFWLALRQAGHPLREQVEAGMGGGTPLASINAKN